MLLFQPLLQRERALVLFLQLLAQSGRALLLPPPARTEMAQVLFLKIAQRGRSLAPVLLLAQMVRLQEQAPFQQLAQRGMAERGSSAQSLRLLRHPRPA